MGEHDYRYAFNKVVEALANESRVESVVTAEMMAGQASSRRGRAMITIDGLREVR
jgi:hypothetical protein